MTTDYHVAWVTTIRGGMATGSMTCTVIPWLHRDNYNEVVEYVRREQDADKPPTITSITKL